MQRAIFVALGTGALITCATAISIGAAAVNEKPRTISRAEYDAALSGIGAARAHVYARCDRATGSEKELCRAEIEADEMVRVADLERAFRGNEAAARNVQRTRIEARYQVDRARCASFGGLKRDRCLISAHATRGRALLEAAGPYEARS